MVVKGLAAQPLEDIFFLLAVNIFLDVLGSVGRTFSKRDNALFLNNTFWVNGLGFILIDRKTPQKLIQGVGGESC
jgi:hypothetical protein